VASTYYIDFRVVLYPAALAIKMSAFTLRAVPTTTGHYITITRVANKQVSGAQKV
jgi:hypothetical protein